MPRDHTDTWFFFGDSVTLGVNDTTVPGGWVSRLALKGAAKGLYRMPPATFYNLGARRQKLAQVAERLEREYSARLMPGIRSKIALCTGTVDMLQGADPSQLVHSLAPLLEKSRGIAPTIFLCPPPVAAEDARKRLGIFGALACDLCRTMNIPCVDLGARLADRDFVSLLTDGIHPGDEGNELLATLLMEQPVVATFLTPSEPQGSL